MRVDVACAGYFKARESVEAGEGGDDFLCDDFGRFAQRAGELERDGSGELAELEVGRGLDGNVLDCEFVFCLQDAANRVRKPLL